VKLVACPECHAQYDLSARAEGGTFACRCGKSLEARAPKAVADAAAERCGACGAIAQSGAEICSFCGSGIVPSVDPGGLICPECFARNLDDARFCAACGVGFTPQAIPVDEAVPAIQCPCCERAMNPREVGGLVVHECGKCHGLWAPQDRFTSLIDRAAETAATRAGAGDPAAPRVDGGRPNESKVEYRRCPVCSVWMARRNHQRRSGVIVDQCHVHGTWLDAGELERIAGFVLSGRAQRVADAESDRERRRESEAADAAVRRVRLQAIQEDSGSLIFGERRAPSAAGTLLDLLRTILD